MTARWGRLWTDSEDDYVVRLCREHGLEIALTRASDEIARTPTAIRTRLHVLAGHDKTLATILGEQPETPQPVKRRCACSALFDGLTTGPAACPACRAQFVSQGVPA